ncbi:hypothetical protein PRIPAC_92296 [Pristionchus pacificus]|uniref:Uncharacterized protein n=1 Tax=Pristionchus pacificus TaxID=54126 RepID=A0A2A6BQN3_PRIPA|nr:hypothetical protein PRIPAC_92296 [Pristionchus pacificus]|eukprot:PDM68230.1 hypothetical protein PRIPAC_46274 [Pristionchus pacificus]
MSGRENFHCELLILVKECNADELVFRFDFFTIQEIVVDEYILDLMNTCSKQTLECSDKMTAIRIHSIYTIIMKRSSKMYSIDFGTTPMAVLREFLLMAGIIYENENLFSDRDIEEHDFVEVVKDDEEDDVYINKHVFNGNLEIKFGRDYDVNDGNLKLNYHQSNKDLENAKATKGFIRTVVETSV